jgi:hypothetical protein
LKGSRHKWLNLHALCEAALPKNCILAQINYYTARVSGSRNPSSPRDQNTYLKALGTLPNLRVHFGNFQVTKTRMPVALPLRFWPLGATPFPVPESLKAIKTEEKGSDVNLAAHLVRDALTGVFEHAAVITNDTDLKEPIRIVVEEANLPLTLLTPVPRPSPDLQGLATHVRNLEAYLGVSQFPSTVVASDGHTMSKPADW